MHLLFLWVHSCIRCSLPYQFIGEYLKYSHFIDRDLSDLNNDGNLDLDEFVIAMHLIDLAKSGQSIPATLPPEIIPVAKKFSTDSDPQLPDVTADGRRGRSESVSSIGKPEPGIYFKVFNYLPICNINRGFYLL